MCAEFISCRQIAGVIVCDSMCMIFCGSLVVESM